MIWGSLGFFQSPGEVIAVVVHGVVGVLGSVETALLSITQPLIHPANDVLGHTGKGLQTSCLIGMHEVLQQLRVVVGHLFKMRHHPALIHRVAMKASRQLIVNPATGHLFQGADEHLPQMRVSAANITLNQQIECGRMRKLGSAAEAAVLLVKHLQHRLDNGVHDCGRKFATPIGEWIVQHITMHVPSGAHAGNYNYWEAWHVPANTRFASPSLLGADDYFGGPRGTTISAEARFYEGLNTPSTWLTGDQQPTTQAWPAHILHATAQNPDLSTVHATRVDRRWWVAP